MMWSGIIWTRKLLSAFSVSFALLLLSSGLGSCSESRTYQISEMELTQLEIHLQALKQNNETLKKILSASGLELTQALDELSKSQTELEKLMNELDQCKSDLSNASESLRIANANLQNASQSFKAFEREAEKTQGRLRTQRNIWETLFFIVAGVAAAR